jgi:hypothetical protein
MPSPDVLLHTFARWRGGATLPIRDFCAFQALFSDAELRLRSPFLTKTQELFHDLGL